MKLICTNVTDDYEDALVKGPEYEATDFNNGQCLITGDRPHKHHGTFQGIKCLDYVVVLGIATFKVKG